MTTRDYNTSVDKYADNIYRFVLKQCNCEEKAKDIVQDTFEKLWKHVHNVSHEKAKSYLFTTAYHTLIDSIRKDRWDMGETIEDVIGNTNEGQYSDVKEVIDKAIKKLPEIQRSVLLLRDYEGYSYQEIGEITGLNESQVKVYIYRARVFLKEYIGSIETLI